MSSSPPAGPAASGGKVGRNPSRLVPFLRSLSGYPRHRRLYPPDHPRLAALLRELREHLKTALEDHEPGQPLILVVRKDSLDVDDAPLKTGVTAVRELARTLRRRRIHVLRIFPEISPAELRRLADLLETDHKEILRCGGPEVFLAAEAHPSIEVVSYEESSLDDAVTAVGGAGSDVSGLGLPEHLVPAFRAVFSSPETQVRVARLRSRVEAYRENRPWAGETVGVIERVLRALLERMDTSDFDVNRLRDVLHHFLDVLGHRLESDPETLPATIESSADRVAALLAFALELPEEERSPELLEKLTYLRELLRPDVGKGGGEPRRRRVGQGWGMAVEGTKSSTTFDVGGVTDIEELTGIRFSEERFRADLESFPVEEMFLRIICELMLTAPDAERYERHREHLVNALAAADRDAEVVVRLLVYVACHLPEPPFEGRDALLRRTLRELGPGPVVGAFFLRMRDHPDALEGAFRAVMEDEAHFSTLASLLLDDQLGDLRKRVEGSFLETARRMPGDLRKWICREGDTAFHPHVFRLLMKLGPARMRTVVQGLLREAKEADRHRLVRALAEEGGPNALEVLVAALPGADRARSPQERVRELIQRGRSEDSELVDALASFKHPRAVAVLRAIVEHGQAGAAGRRHAATAIRSLARIGTPETREILRRVAEERRWLRYRYHSELRALAAQLLLKGAL